MSTLETTFYFMGIVYMIIMFIMIGILVYAALVIKSKVDRVHKMVDEKVTQAQDFAGKLTMGLDVIKGFLGKH